MHKRFAFGFLPLLLPLFSAGSSAWAEPVAKIEAVFGEGAVQVRTTKGTANAAVGRELAVGDRIVTGAKNSAVLRYQDGTKLDIARETDFKLEDSEKGTQWNRLKLGEVHASVTKQTGGALKKPRFVIRTKSMTMGVRGTEFVLGADSSGVAQLHTLEGAVDAAPNELALMSGKGVSVPAGNAISADRSGLRPQTEFNSEAFKRNIESNYLSPAEHASGAGATDGSAAAAASSSTAPLRAASVSAPMTVAPRVQAPLPPNLGNAKPPEAANAPKPEDTQKKDNGPNPNARKIRLLAAQVGGVYGIFKTRKDYAPGISGAMGPAGSVNPNGGFYGSGGEEQTYFTSFVFSYTPSAPLPVLSFLFVRGQFSLLIFKEGFANDSFLVHELAGFLGTDLLNPLFVEVGYGRQYFRTKDLANNFFAIYAGIILNPNGFLNRVFVGRTELDGNPVRVEEYTAGIGIQL